MIIVESIQEIYDTPKVVTDYSPPHRDLHDINYSPIKTSNPIEITETYLFLSPPLSKNKTNKKKKKKYPENNFNIHTAIFRPRNRINTRDSKW